MSELNLLPPQFKKQIAQDTRAIELSNHVILIGIAVLIVAVMFFSSQTLLNYRASRVIAADNHSQENSNIEQINAAISQAEVIGRDYVKWSRLTVNFFNLFPVGVNIHELKIDRSDKSVSITGYAASRENYLELTRHLEQSDLIESVNSPITNLLKQNDINFTLNTKLKF